jgi:hypothetical protein
MYKKLDTSSSSQAPKNRISPHYRTPWVVTCKSWIYQNKAIELYANPSKISWSHGRRGTSVKTAAGTVRNVWYNHYRGTYYDEAELKVTFQSGNIMPFMAYLGGNYNFSDPAVYNNLINLKEAVPQGLLDFYRFKELLNEPAYLGPAENRHIMTYHSRVFPKMYLEGFFKDEDPITWEESAEGGGTAGNTLNWTATFVVYDSYPRLDSASQMIAAYSSWLAQEGMVEALPMNSGTAFTLAAIQEADGKEDIAAPAQQGTDTSWLDNIYSQINAGQTLPPNPADPPEPPPKPPAPPSSPDSARAAKAAAGVSPRTRSMLGR